MDYDIVLVTADRPEVLAVSIPTFMNQSRPAKRLIVVDASHDHQPLADRVRALTADAPFEVQVIRGPRGMTIQRNVGIRQVEAPVVFFPDDDSLWRNDVAERVMRVYERDTEGRIGGVCQAAADAPPYKLSKEDEAARRASTLDRVKYQLAKLRFRIMGRLIASPLELCGRELMSRHEPPAWLGEVGAAPVPFQIGFRMTFRTEAVRRHPFNEDIHQPRCGLEDFDESYAVLADSLLVEATGALTYHHRVGGKRGNAIETGLTQMLNPTYVVCRHSPSGSRSRRALKRYLRYFIWEHRLGRRLSEFDRQKLRGMRLGMAAVDSLLDAAPDQLTDRYQHAFERGLNGKSVLEPA